MAMSSGHHGLWTSRHSLTVRHLMLGYLVLIGITAGVQGGPVTADDTEKQGVFCPPVLDPGSGQSVLSDPISRAVNSTVIYTCDADHALKGSDTATCTADGQWSSQPPQCILDCGALTAPTNAVTEVQCTYVNCTAQVSCTDGYMADGSTALTRGDRDKEVDKDNSLDIEQHIQSTSACLSDGTWSNVDLMCVAIRCSDLPVIAHAQMTSAEPADHEYRYGASITFTCDTRPPIYGDDDSPNDSANLFLYSTTFMCQSDGSWSGNHLLCSEPPPNENPSNNTYSLHNVTSGNASNAAGSSTEVTLPEDCPSPPTPPHAQFHMHYANGVIYECDPGFTLYGDGELYCNNKTWIGTTPKCLVNDTEFLEPVITPVPYLWKQVFVDNKVWDGLYGYNEQKVHFKFWVVSVDIHPEGLVEAHFVEEKAKLHLKGYRADNQVVFELLNLQESSERFPSTLTKWISSGHLEKHGHHNWRFHGHIVSNGHNEFTTFDMKASKGTQKNPLIFSPVTPSSNVKALALGITIAIIAIVLAAALAAYCVTRKTAFGGSGHRTLTSFENPVYEYENTLK